MRSMPTKNMGMFKFSDGALVEAETEDEDEDDVLFLLLPMPGGQMPCGTTVPT